MALPQAKIDATDARLAGLNLPTAGWSADVRADALARVRAMGLPGRRDEYWKYTNPETLINADAPNAAVFDAQEAPMFDGVDRIKIVFVDGVLTHNDPMICRARMCQLNGWPMWQIWICTGPRMPMAF